MASDIEITMEISQEDLIGFESTIVEFARMLGKEVGDVLVPQARLIAVNLAYNTQPYGLDDSALKRGQWAVMRDVGRVYKSIDVVYAQIARTSEDQARAFYAAAQRGDAAVAKHILRGCGLNDLLGADIGPMNNSLQGQFRDRRGRVRIKTPRLIVTDPKELVRRQRELVARVGTGKSSWASCARACGGVRGIPLWATRNRASGTVQDLSRRADDPRVILKSHVDYMPTICPPAMQRDAVEKQKGKMQTAIRMAAERAARRSRLAA